METPEKQRKKGFVSSRLRSQSADIHTTRSRTPLSSPPSGGSYTRSTRTLKKELREKTLNPSPELIAQLKNLYCCNIPSHLMDRDILREHFSQFGPVVRVYLSMKKCSCTVHFKTHEAAELAKQRGGKLQNQQLYICWSLPATKTLSRMLKDEDLDMSVEMKSEQDQPRDDSQEKKLKLSANDKGNTSESQPSHLVSKATEKLKVKRRSPKSEKPKIKEQKVKTMEKSVTEGRYAVQSEVAEELKIMREVEEYEMITDIGLGLDDNSAEALDSPLSKSTTSHSLKAQKVTQPPYNLSHDEWLVKLMQIWKGKSRRQFFTDEEKYRILDLRDRILRLKTKKQNNITTSEVTRGTCEDMCPEKERYQRQSRKQIGFYESPSPGNIYQVMDHSRAVKVYSRSSADQEEPLPHDLRPTAVLRMTMDFLLSEVADMCTDNYEYIGEWYYYLWDRTRSIRKDVTQQALCNIDAVNLIEECARFHIHCSGRLVDEKANIFDQKINTENLTKCLQTLKYLYHDLALKGVTCPNEAEFRGYNILLNLKDCNFLWELKEIRSEIVKSEPVQFAIRVFDALNNNNYIRFFNHVKRTTYLNACILLRYFYQVRCKAVETIVKTYGSALSYPMKELAKQLLFENVKECERFCAHLSLPARQIERETFLHRGIIKVIDTVLPQRHKKMIESKMKNSVGEIIKGGPLTTTNFKNYKSHTSFNIDGSLKEEVIKQVEGMDIQASASEIGNDFPKGTKESGTEVPREETFKQDKGKEIVKRESTLEQTDTLSKMTTAVIEGRGDGAQPVPSAGKSHLSDTKPGTSEQSESKLFKQALDSLQQERMKRELLEVQRMKLIHQHVPRTPEPSPIVQLKSLQRSQQRSEQSSPLKGLQRGHSSKRSSESDEGHTPLGHLSEEYRKRKQMQQTVGQVRGKYAQLSERSQKLKQKQEVEKSVNKIYDEMMGELVRDEINTFEERLNNVAVLELDELMLDVECSMTRDVFREEIREEQLRLAKEAEERKKKLEEEEKKRRQLEETANKILDELVNTVITETVVEETNFHNSAVQHVEEIELEVVHEEANYILEFTIIELQKEYFIRKYERYREMKYFNIWRTKVQKIVRMRNSMADFPAIFSTLTLDQQVAELAKPPDPLIRKHPVIFTEVLTESEADVTTLKFSDLVAYSAFIQSPNKSLKKYFKLVVSLPDKAESPCRAEMLENMINIAFPRTVKIDDMNSILLENSIFDQNKSLSVSMRLVVGPSTLNTREKDSEVVAGMNGIMFIIDHTTKDLERTRERLHSLLTLRKYYGGIVVAILITHKMDHNVTADMVDQLQVAQLEEATGVKNYLNMFLKDPKPGGFLTMLMQAVAWISATYEKVPTLECVSLSQLTHKCLVEDLWIPFIEVESLDETNYKAIKLDLETAIDIQNEACSALCRLVNDETISALSIGAPEFARFVPVSEVHEEGYKVMPNHYGSSEFKNMVAQIFENAALVCPEKVKPKNKSEFYEYIMSVTTMNNVHQEEFSDIWVFIKECTDHITADPSTIEWVQTAFANISWIYIVKRIFKSRLHQLSFFDNIKIRNRKLYVTGQKRKQLDDSYMTVVAVEKEKIKQFSKNEYYKFVRKDITKVQKAKAFGALFGTTRPLSKKEDIPPKKTPKREAPSNVGNLDDLSDLPRIEKSIRSNSTEDYVRNMRIVKEAIKDLRSMHKSCFQTQKKLSKVLELFVGDIPPGTSETDISSGGDSMSKQI